MAKRDKEERKNRKNGKEEKKKDSILSNWVKRWIKATIMFLVAVVSVLSFPYFDKAGYAGELFIKTCDFLIGKAFYTIPLFFFAAGLIFLKTRKKGKDLAMFLAILVSLVGVSGILAVRNLDAAKCGWFCSENNIGLRLAQFFSGLFGVLVANIIFGVVLLIGLFIFLQFVWQEMPKKDKEEKPTFAVNRPGEDNPKIKGIESEKTTEKPKQTPSRITLFKKSNEEPEKAEIKKPGAANKNNYILPPLD
ncbi:MAG: DNA translocase FtsK 4TM domain-containing protein, partial [Candidatus Staskawiczbacteria bacterium]|nr:DNA translocase FtsK 4TM domain-containing protein [Candidatus Staskawiczbacteria bacterium]